MLKLFRDMKMCSPEEVRRLMGVAPRWRCNQALQFKHTFGRFACLKTYEMLCQGLAEMGFVGAGEWVDFVVDEHGKPHLADLPGVHFNISHCPNALAVAVDVLPVGVDVEKRRPLNDSLLRHTMNDEEQRLIRASEDPALAFSLFWTRKEALVKWLGTGITGSLHDVLRDMPPSAEMRCGVEEDFAWTVVRGCLGRGNDFSAPLL